MIGGGRTFFRENLADTDPPACKMPILDTFSPVAPLPYHLAKTVQLTLIRSPLRVSNEPKMNIVRCP